MEIIEKELDDLRLDTKWGKTCESFLNLVDNKLKDHQGITPDPMQFPDSWYITRLNRTIEPHTTLYQFIINHQMQADAIAWHTGTPSIAATTYESHLKHVQTFCQKIDHTNCKAVQEKTRCKALQAEFEQANGRGRNGRGEGRGHGHGHGDRWGGNPGRGRRSEGTRRAHQWVVP